MAKTTSELTNYQLIGKDGVRAYNLPADWQRRRQILLAMVRSRSSSTEKKSPKKGSFKEAGRIIQKLADFYDLDWFDLWTGRQALKFSNTVKADFYLRSVSSIFLPSFLPVFFLSFPLLSILKFFCIYLVIPHSTILSSISTFCIFLLFLYKYEYCWSYEADTQKLKL